MRHMDYKSGGGGVFGSYFLGFLGALTYFWQTAGSFWDGVLGLLEALVWPAFLVYHLFLSLKI